MHNHITRDIKAPGKCPGCDLYHEREGTMDADHLINQANYLMAEITELKEALAKADVKALRHVSHIRAQDRTIRKKLSIIEDQRNTLFNVLQYSNALCEFTPTQPIGYMPLDGASLVVTAPEVGESLFLMIRGRTRAEERQARQDGILRAQAGLAAEAATQ